MKAINRFSYLSGIRTTAEMRKTYSRTLILWYNRFEKAVFLSGRLMGCGRKPCEKE